MLVHIILVHIILVHIMLIHIMLVHVILVHVILVHCCSAILLLSNPAAEQGNARWLCNARLSVIQSRCDIDSQSL